MLPKYNRAATFQSLEDLCGTDSSGVSLEESLYSLRIILFEITKVNNIEKSRHESANWL